MGLNDLLYDSVRLFRLKPDYARQWAHSFQHIMVDEYQDSNPLQHWLLDTLLTEDPSRSLMVVGDEDQCIYTWRAADPDMMVRGFEQRYAGTQRFLLSRTFRYGHAVALMANHVLAYNTQRPDKTVVSGLASSCCFICMGSPIVWKERRSFLHEARAWFCG
jgi:DNA helicase-2/ATP-dependent DNA helicase PcrA